MTTKVKFNGKRVLLFSFLLFSTIFYCQTFIRNSDEKVFDNIIVKHDGKDVEINKTNFKDFLFNTNDKIVYNNKLLDFSMTQDTLYFFDKVKEIEAVEIVKFNGKKKTISNNKKRASAEIFANNRIASLIEIESEKKTFVKSLILFINKFQVTDEFEGILKIQILKNINGLPDDSSELASFEMKVAEIMANRKPFTYKKIQIDFPNIIKYPKEGLFVVLLLETGEKHTVSLTQNDDTPMFIFYPKEGWKKQDFNGYYYQLKILQ